MCSLDAVSLVRASIVDGVTVALPATLKEFIQIVHYHHYPSHIEIPLENLNI